MTRRPSAQTVAVLRAFAVDPSTWRYGYELGVEVGLKAGSLYTILIRLCDRGQLEATWETDAPPGRPPRHLYRLLPAGLRLCAELGDPRVERPQVARATTAAPRALRPLGGQS
ncbi:PadR family transcriptional regulator [Cellulomonas sp. McL0617]|uniref:PadR family transcriptional regulator n=1 Tax=Cellulomonas sp. McL0617 TaxID=3415675 RepID=UPI003CF5DF2F